ncbi:MAG TPA: outer membrane protein assembly factor BamC [Oligoflexia bacterium]|nr:outer membrane protein assembly factor BamC [Oligoflexia bacterium]HMR24881.1 outer membrane protein assembly factor BamC [Oligoflexia bacterium]
MKKLSFLMVLLVLPGLSACLNSKKQFAEPYVQKNDTAGYSTQQIYGYSYKDTWEATNEVLNAINTPILVSRREHGLIITDWITGKSSRLFSGYGESKIPYKIRYKMKVTVQPSKQGTVITIDSKEQYYTDVISGQLDFQGSLYRWVETKPGGEIQKNLLQQIQNYLAQSSSTQS